MNLCRVDSDACFLEHDVVTVADASWSGLTNGRLLPVAQEQFDCLLTADRSPVYQQPLPRFDIAVIVLRAKTNRLEDLVPLIPRTLELLPMLQPGQSVEIP